MGFISEHLKYFERGLQSKRDSTLPMVELLAFILRVDAFVELCPLGFTIKQPSKATTNLEREPNSQAARLELRTPSASAAYSPAVHKPNG